MYNHSTSMAKNFIVPLTMLVFMAYMNHHIAKKKGENPGLFVFLTFIPFVNIISFFYLVSLTDQVVNNRINSIIEKLKK